LDKKKHPLVPVPQGIPDEGEIRAGFIRANTISMKKPSNMTGFEDTKDPDGRISSSNINKVVDFYASTFGNQNNR